MAIGNNSTAVVGKFIANRKDPRVYDTGELGKLLQSDMIILSKKHLIQVDDNIKELQEDDNKDEVNRHNDYNREELDGPNIPGDVCKLTTHTTEDKENENSYKYEDILVKDEEMGVEYIAMKLIVAKLQDIPRNASTIEVAKLYDRLTTTNEYTIREVDDLIEKYNITEPATNNSLSPAYRRNPLYKASKYPIKTSGDMHHDLSKNLFDHCHSELNSSHAKFPYGVFQLYTDTKPKTVPGKCLFILKDPKVLQLVYYVNHSDKSHPGYLKVQNLMILMFTMDMQKSGESPKRISLHDAVTQRIVSNQVVAYFIGKIYEFYTCIRMSEKLRFKQQCDAECWVAEIKCSDGWIECAKISGKNAAALEAKLDPIEAEETFLESAFKNNSKKVAEALKAMGEEEKEAMMADIKSKGEYEFFVGTLLKMVTIKPNMLRVTKEKKTIYVVAVSFRIGRIVCCLYEHAYNPKPGKNETLLTAFSFPPLVAPYKCFIIEQKKKKHKTTTQLTKESLKKKKHKTATQLTKESLDKAGIRYMTDTQGKDSWKKLILSDECGCPIAVRGNSEDSVMIRVQGSDNIIIVKVDDVVQPIEDILNEVCTWDDTCKKYPLVTYDKNRVKPNPSESRENRLVLRIEDQFLMGED